MTCWRKLSTAERSGLLTAESPSLIVGLGNPGAAYAAHRHNIGFQIVDTLARANGLVFSRREGKVRVAAGLIIGRPVILAKPQTFMNLSGRAVSRLCRVYHVPLEQLLVVHDDLDLPLGRLRLRSEGGAGGHKGMRSIIDVLGTQAFPRLRVGIGRPPGHMDPAEYVLQPFGTEEESLVSLVVDEAAKAVECWLGEGISAAMDQFNRERLQLGDTGSPSTGACQRREDGT